MTTSPMPAEARRSSARLEVDYPERLDRFTTLFRLIWVVPIAVVLGAITASGNQTVVTAWPCDRHSGDANQRPGCARPPESRAGCPLDAVRGDNRHPRRLLRPTRRIRTHARSAGDRNAVSRGPGRRRGSHVVGQVSEPHRNRLATPHARGGVIVAQRPASCPNEPAANPLAPALLLATPERQPLTAGVRCSAWSP